MASALVAEFGRPDVIVAGGYDHGNFRKPFDDTARSLRRPVTLKQFLQHNAGRMDRFTAGQSISQAMYLGHVGG